MHPILSIYWGRTYKTNKINKSIDEFGEFCFNELCIPMESKIYSGQTFGSSYPGILSGRVTASIDCRKAFTVAK